MACSMTLFTKTKKEFQHVPFMLNILLVLERLKDEKAHVFFR